MTVTTISYEKYVKELDAKLAKKQATARKNQLKKGVILFEGYSELDGAPIAVIATKNSHNRKTGKMIQTWIIRTDMSPLDAVKTGADYSICGNCPHRGINGKKRSCYVKVFQAPLSVYNCYKRGNYQFLSECDYEDYFKGYHFRIGSYGDPAMIPALYWYEWSRCADGHTGYTHQWKNDLGKYLNGLVQASCDNLADYMQAKKDNWSTFRVTTNAEKQGANETLCLNASHGLTCEKCGLCNGARADVVIQIHGQGKRNFQD